jgi:hypothetical protein
MSETDDVKLRAAEHMIEMFERYLQWRSEQSAAGVATNPEPNFVEFMFWLGSRVDAAHGA